MAGKQGGKAQVIEQKGDLSLREHRQMGKIQRAQVARKRNVLQQGQRKSISYLAANDLYGWAMSRPLPK